MAAAAAGLALAALAIEKSPEPQGRRIAHSPTGENALPDALLGKAPAPRGEPVHYFAGNPKSRGYLAMPEGDGPFGGVILIHEWNGLVDRVRQMADALAAEGYAALAADLYSGRTGSGRQENIALMTEARSDMGQVIANLNAAAQYLRERPQVSGKIATIGWCFGGGIALSYAMGGENHDATAIFYGGLIDDPERMRGMHHEVYGTFGRKDRNPSPEQVGRFVEALRKAGIPNDIHIYDEVGHGFWLWVDQEPDVRSKPALDAWQRLKKYLNRTVGGS